MSEWVSSSFNIEHSKWWIEDVFFECFFLLWLHLCAIYYQEICNEYFNIRRWLIHFRFQLLENVEYIYIASSFTILKQAVNDDIIFNICVTCTEHLPITNVVCILRYTCHGVGHQMRFVFEQIIIIQQPVNDDVPSCNQIVV